jgi:hypothetical protein
VLKVQKFYLKPTDFLKRNFCFETEGVRGNTIIIGHDRDWEGRAGRDAALAAINNNANNDLSEGIMNLTNAGKKWRTCMKAPVGLALLCLWVVLFIRGN